MFCWRLTFSGISMCLWKVFMMQLGETAPPPPTQDNQGCQSYSSLFQFHQWLKTIIQREISQWLIMFPSRENPMTLSHWRFWEQQVVSPVWILPEQSGRSENANISTWWNNVAIINTVLSNAQTNITKHHEIPPRLPPYNIFSNIHII